ncbi:ROK family protein [Sphingobacteriaceae bacterium WQ 2009]|uniref:ROK family protein n=1 Tax=Rhinopithecimicrobium faecis TaxID=2820698 RepID=A0A8T4HC33_9SPHI|nr:ROK family protein [Sphingobacteriaceae bacterium WQ 2009]
MKTLRYSLCMDIGGTHISVALIDKSTMTVVQNAYITHAVTSNSSKEVILRQWSGAISTTLLQAGQHPDQVVIAMPGPFDYKQGISLMDGMHKYQALLAMDVKGYFAELLQIQKANIHFYNDAAAFLYGEVFAQNLQTSKVVGLSLGTGLGSACYESGISTDLNFGSAPFQSGIAEDYISTRGIISSVAARFQQHYPGVKELLAVEVSPEIRQFSLAYLVDNLTLFLQQYIRNLQPDIIILGGSIAKAHPLFLADLQQHFSVPIAPASFDPLNLFLGLTSFSQPFDSYEKQ